VSDLVELPNRVERVNGEVHSFYLDAAKTFGYSDVLPAIDKPDGEAWQKPIRADSRASVRARGFVEQAIARDYAREDARKKLAQSSSSLFGDIAPESQYPG
jgi:hypothetical protein